MAGKNVRWIPSAGEEIAGTLFSFDVDSKNKIWVLRCEDGSNYILPPDASAIIVLAGIPEGAQLTIVKQADGYDLKLLESRNALMPGGSISTEQIRDRLNKK